MSLDTLSLLSTSSLGQAAFQPFDLTQSQFLVCRYTGI